MATNFTGNWKLVESENLEAYLKAMDNDAVKTAMTGTPRCEIQQDGDNFRIKIIALKTTEINFKVGEEFEGELQQGKAKITPSWDGNKLRFDIDSQKGKQIQEREILADGRLRIVLGAPDGTKCTRILARE